MWFGCAFDLVRKPTATPQSDTVSFDWVSCVRVRSNARLQFLFFFSHSVDSLGCPPCVEHAKKTQARETRNCNNLTSYRNSI